MQEQTGKQLSLNAVKKEFEKWRKSKEHPSTKIPTYLWDKVIQLLPTNKITKIITTLRISSGQLNSKIKEFKNLEFTHNSLVKSNAKQFFELPLQTSFISNNHLAKIEITTNDGTKLCIGANSDQQSTNIINSFLRRGVL